MLSKKLTDFHGHASPQTSLLHIYHVPSLVFLPHPWGSELPPSTKISLSLSQKLQILQSTIVKRRRQMNPTILLLPLWRRRYHHTLWGREGEHSITSHLLLPDVDGDCLSFHWEIRSNTLHFLNPGYGCGALFCFILCYRAFCFVAINCLLCFIWILRWDRRKIWSARNK